MSITALKRDRLRFIICIVIPILLSSAAPREAPNQAQAVPLMQVIEFFDLGYHFSSTTGAMRLERGEMAVTFVLGSSEVFTQDRVYHLQGRMETGEGILMMSAEGVDLLIRQLFDRSMNWRYRRDRLSALQSRVTDRSPSYLR